MNFNDLSVGISIKTADKNGIGLVMLSIFGGAILLENVYINPLLLSRLNDETNEDFVYGRDYMSANNSSEYKLNPLTLVKYSAEDGEDKFYLTLVNKAKTEKSRVTLPTGVVVDVYKNFYYAKKDWYRYVDTTNDVFHPFRKKVYQDTEVVGIE